MKKLFEIGKTVMTPGVAESIPPWFISDCLNRHQSGDFGLMSDEDKMQNQEAINVGMSIMSAFEFEGTRFWIITEHDRSVTTILLPDEY